MLETTVLVAPEMKWYTFEGLTDNGDVIVSNEKGEEHEIAFNRIDHLSDACCGPISLTSLLDEEAVLEITEEF